MENNIKERIKKIKIVIMDVDGVMSDGTIILGSNNVEYKCFDARDGIGIKYLERVGIRTAIITGRKSESVDLRAKELGIEYVYQNAKVKNIAYQDLKEKTGFTDEECAYIGDDVLDIPLFRRVGLAIAPADASEDAKEFVHYVTEKKGGKGAVREIVDLVIKGQDKWDKIMARYLED